MQSYSFTWTDPVGRHRASAVAYDKASADRRRKELEAEGCTDIEIVEVGPGQLPEPRS
ncbi:hypothetical protein AB0E62_33970 [Streptomyces sp. NPDC038707]|uniref:hypothetical protein n=1 Tax=Streptomyces sp. NPDC038707 TaxID=3154329 RepID=UPI0033EA32ED